MTATLRQIETRIGPREQPVAVSLLPERAMAVPSESALLIADTHWGKSETMRSLGVPIPPGTLDEQFERLRSTLERTGSSRLFVLGDLLHDPRGVTDTLRERVAAFFESLGNIETTLVAGNHDLKLGGGRLERFAQECGIGLTTEATLGGLRLVHDPTDGIAAYSVGGHIHPSVTLRGAGDTLKLPAFVLGEQRTILPAFSRFTGGGRFERAAGDRVFLCAEDRVIGL